MPQPSTTSAMPPTSIPRRPRVGVLGATLGTGNLGVDALGISIVQGLVQSIPNVEIVYQAWDLRLPIDIPIGEKTITCEPLAIRRKGSLRHRDGLLQIKKLAMLRRWLSARAVPKLPTFSYALKQLLSCDAILDVSAGDSFANIYGPEVFWYQTQIKLLCIELGLPLILMPQTYGPFDDETSAKVAGTILSRVTLACSREADGILEIKRLCHDRPPQKLVRVPDMAFLLEPRKTELPPNFVQAQRNSDPCIALNVSGLLYFAQHLFGLRVDYRQLTSDLVKWALSVPNSHVLLVPHVVAPTKYPGSKTPKVPSADSTDTKACEALLAELGKDASARVDILPPPKGPAEAKYALNLCDFFVGARMHAFIGATSQCVPGALLAYSKKAEGLASLLGIGDAVVDMRSDSVDDCVAAVSDRYQRRQATQAILKERVPLAKAELRRFFNEEIAPLVLGNTATASDPHPQLDHSNTSSRPTEVLS